MEKTAFRLYRNAAISILSYKIYPGLERDTANQYLRLLVLN
jgi:hypothetical protein